MTPKPRRTTRAPHIARLPGTCQGCGQPFVLHKDEIVRLRNGDNVHTTCTDKD